MVIWQNGKSKKTNNIKNKRLMKVNTYIFWKKAKSPKIYKYKLSSDELYLSHTQLYRV